MCGLTASFLSRSVAVFGVVVALAFAGLDRGVAQSVSEARVEVRVWQHVQDDDAIYVSAREAHGSWRTLGTIALPLDDGFSSTGQYRYGDIALSVGVERGAAIFIHVRVWQDTQDGRNIRISVRYAGGLWSTVGTTPVLLDDGLNPARTLRYGDIAFDVPLTVEQLCLVRGAVQPEDHPQLVDDCAALLKARDALVGEGIPLNWSAFRPVSEWSGVTVSRERPGGVTKITLNDSGLRGAIPKELGRLAHLKSLDLSENNLTGPIPPEVGALSSLSNLNLLRNQLTGVIPTELAQLSSLERLSLGGNQLTGGIPPELRALQHLRMLDLGDNQLTGTIPPDLGALQNLEQLFLSENDLIGRVPLDIGAIATLRMVALEGTKVECIPGSLESRLLEYYLGDGTRVRPFDPPVCQAVTDLPAVPAVDEAHQEACRVEGAVQQPRRNSGLVDDCAVLLEARDVLVGTDGTPLNWTSSMPIEEWEGVDVEGSPGRVVALWLGAKNLRGEIPSVLAHLGALDSLTLHRNALTGAVPPQLGHLENLEWIWLSDNRLTGPVPRELAALAGVTEIRLQGNQLDGGIPPEFGHLANLRELNLRGNQLTGEIPPELAALPQLDLSKSMS